MRIMPHRISNIEMVARFAYSELSGDRYKYLFIPNEIVELSRRGVPFHEIDERFHGLLFFSICRHEERSNLVLAILQYPAYVLCENYDITGELYVVPALWGGNNPKTISQYAVEKDEFISDRYSPYYTIRNWDSRIQVDYPIISLFHGMNTVVDGTTRLTKAIIDGRSSSKVWKYSNLT